MKHKGVVKSRDLVLLEEAMRYHVRWAAYHRVWREEHPVLAQELGVKDRHEDWALALARCWLILRRLERKQAEGQRR